MALSVNHILIVGGGIAGLCAAIALGRRGAKVTVVDLHGQAEGASIGITNRAVFALEELGVLDAVISAGIALRGEGNIFSNMYDGAGNPLPVPPQPTRQETTIPSAVSIYRPELARILTEAANKEGAEIITGETVSSLVEKENRVEVVFKNGQIGHFDMVIGADGTRSAVRRMIFGDIVKPEYTGLMGFRCIIENGPEGKPGFYSLGGSEMVATTRLPGNMLYLATGIDMENRHLSQDEARTILLKILEPYTAPLLAAARERIATAQNIIARPYEWLMLPPPWNKGRIVIIGDAAHSTTAHLSSGGGMAMEDAVVLAQELDRGLDTEQSLNNFMVRRLTRTSLVVNTSVEILRLQQANSGQEKMGQLRAKAFGALMQPY